MAIYVYAVSILPDKTDEYRKWAQELMSSRRSEFEEAQRLVGITQEHWFLQNTPQGEISIIYFEADDPARVFQQVGSSDLPFEQWFRQHLLDIFGIDLSKPSTEPLNEQVLVWHAS